ncbi:Rne/Rng family ribonuclease [Nocardioides sp.]|uniref:ribonuclease E/G n=1 Tax=Nocardioides sp. TaxID=35761 RepID=UPI00286B3A6B|nr:Rne/Rng family ribonuclease [Nocardioides sp.]
MADDDTTSPDTPVTEVVPTDTTSGTPGDAPAKPAKKAAAKRAPAKKTAAKRTAKKAAPASEPLVEVPAEAEAEAPAPAKKAAARKTAAKKAPAKKAAAKRTAAPAEQDAPTETTEAAAAEADAGAAAPMVLFQAPEKTTPARRTRKSAATRAAEAAAADASTAPAEPDEVAPAIDAPPARTPRKRSSSRSRKPAAETPVEPSDDEIDDEVAAATAASATSPEHAPSAEADQAADDGEGDEDNDDDGDNEASGEGGGPRRRRRRGGRRRRKAGDNDDSAGDDAGDDSSDDSDNAPQGSRNQGGRGQGGRGNQNNQGGQGGQGNQGGQSGPGNQAEQDDDAGDEGGSTRRRRRRRREGEGDAGGNGDEPNTVTRVRKPRNAEDEITAIAGSTRLEAKKQRRREGREAGRRRAPIVSEAEFLARRESVDRVMVIRQADELTQIGVLEDKVLVEHYVARESQTSLIGNVYLGRVQNVLPSMEAAFIDIGKGRNAVLYAGEVNWSALGHKDGQSRKIESVLSSGQSILVQVTKDPVGHKGARLTSQVSLAGRFLVYVPDGTTSGISRKLPDTERNRLKSLLKEIVPETAGVIVRTAAEGASEEELTHDVERLKARWDDIDGKAKGQAPQLLYGEPDLTLKVVRDLFTEDFKELVIQGEEAWESVQSYVAQVAPDLQDRVKRYDGGGDAFATYRIDEQIAKGLDRKVWLPSGGSLVIDRTEAMTVVDVNTGKFTGSGGNLEETVTKNNLEAAEEIVRQLRLRDIGGIIVVDFIDMVLESNRDLVLRRLVECLGRDRTRHQVAEVTSLGLVQMTRKKIGTGLVEAFSHNCEHCQGRGLVIQDHPVEPKGGGGDEQQSRPGSGGGRRSRGRGRGQQDDQAAPAQGAPKATPSPKDIAAMAKPENAGRAADEVEDEVEETPVVENPAPSEPESQEQAVEAEPFVEAEPAAATEPEPEPEAPAEPEAPKVVTRTRRTTRSTATISTTPATMPSVVVSAAPEQAAVPVVTAEPPKVVTRTRGRARAAEPEPTADEPTADESAVEHVPVKKKGARKR